MPNQIPTLDSRNILARPRIHALMSEALKHPFVSVIGGPGTGKTTAVAEALGSIGRPVMWYSATTLDELAERGWREFIAKLVQVMPSAAQALLAIPFSSTLEFVYAFVKVWNEYTRDEPAPIWVFDNFHMINRLKDKYARAFLRLLWLDRPDNLQVVLISASENDRSLDGAIPESGLFSVSASDLNFTLDEIGMLLSHRQVGFTSNKVARLLALTGGWAYALTQYLLHQFNRPEDQNAGVLFDPAWCARRIKDEWLPTYSEPEQALFFRLALLPAFSDEIIKSLSEMMALPMALHIAEDPFVTRDAHTRLYTLQVVVKQYLCSMTKLLPASEIVQIYKQAGDWFRSTGHDVHALYCYGNGRHFDDMLDVLKLHAGPGIRMKTALTAQHYLNELPKEYFDANPFAHVLMAHIKLGMHDLDGAEAMLNELVAKCEPLPRSPTRDEILGETYLAIVCLYSLKTQPGSLKYLEMAAELLPNGSSFTPEYNYPTPNESIIQIKYAHADTLAIMEDEMRIFEQFAKFLYNKQPDGLASLFAAEAAFLRNDTQSAVRHIIAAFEESTNTGQHTVVFNTLFLRMRLAVMSGNPSGVYQVLVKIEEYVDQRNLTYLRPACEYLRAWLYVKTELLGQVPLVVKYPYTFTELPESSRTSYQMIIHIDYAIATGNVEHAFLMVNHAQNYAKSLDLWHTQIILHLRRALCHHLRGEHELMVSSFAQAYDMAYPAGLIAPFIEFGKHMRTLIGSLTEQEQARFSKEWLTMSQTKSNSYAKRIASIRNSLPKGAKETPLIRLTAREMEVLHLLAGGMTREEIAERLSITIHGVKRHITSLYNKLGASNRSEIIRIAAALELIE